MSNNFLTFKDDNATSSTSPLVNSSNQRVLNILNLDTIFNNDVTNNTLQRPSYANTTTNNEDVNIANISNNKNITTIKKRRRATYLAYSLTTSYPTIEDDVSPIIKENSSLTLKDTSILIKDPSLKALTTIKLVTSNIPTSIEVNTTKEANTIIKLPSYKT